ncbi:MAG: CTP synthase [Ignavibacteriaceae bacterium]|nr:CTP synthase [Ignavibacteriaceae bacterium]
MSSTKYIFISGGVISGLGKGVTSASLGVLLKSRGYKVTAIKCESYLNVDSGTINPIEHGDPFLCNDGLEADMDLGTYERFLDIEVGKKNFLTMGMVYKNVIERERSMGYQGKTVDAIPAIPNEIIDNIKKAGEGYDICLVELGGTAGEYQNIFNYEAARMMKLFHPEDVLHVHITYVPVPEHLGEPKTKPTQLSMRFLNMSGIQPDFLVLRSNQPIDTLRKDKVAVQCNMPKERLILNADLRSIYELPIKFEEQGFDTKVLKLLGLRANPLKFDKWKSLVTTVTSLRKNRVTIAIAGKYIATGDYQLPDAYNSLTHALKHASWGTQVGVDFKFVNTEDIEKQSAQKLLEDVDGIIVPIGWGSRGVEGKISAIEYARENKIPYLGLCFGMQLACVEFARNIVKYQNANSEEVDPHTQYKIIHSIPFDPKYQVIKGEGTSMRLGAFDCEIRKGTLAFEIYSKYKMGKHLKNGNLLVSERHRHRFEFNNEYRKELQKKGMVFSGTSPDDFFVEVIELPKKIHPFFLATQAHPEYKSSPLNPHPFFLEFVSASEKFKKSRK